MKIGFTGLNLPEGKVKYEDDVLNALAAKDRPKKVTPYFAEFVCNEFIDCDAILVGDSSILDVLITDIEKIEARGNQQSDTDCVCNTLRNSVLSEFCLSTTSRSLFSLGVTIITSVVVPITSLTQ